jgi:hypothetical protein
LGLLGDHFVELVVPWFSFGPRTARHIAGVLLVSFQIVLIISGNLVSELCHCFLPADGMFLRRRRHSLGRTATQKSEQSRINNTIATHPRSRLLLSIAPVLNYFRPELMNILSLPIRKHLRRVRARSVANAGCFEELMTR